MIYSKILSFWWCVSASVGFLFRLYWHCLPQWFLWLTKTSSKYVILMKLSNLSIATVNWPWCNSVGWSSRIKILIVDCFKGKDTFYASWLWQVKVTTALGSRSPPLKVKVVRAFISGSKDVSVIENQVQTLYTSILCFGWYHFDSIVLCQINLGSSSWAHLCWIFVS